MIQKQNVRDRKPLKEQLRERCQGHFSFPETVTEGWDKGETLEAIAELLEEANVQSSREKQWTKIGNIAPILGIMMWGIFIWFRTHNPFVTCLGLISFTIATLIFHLVSRRRSEENLLPAHLTGILRLTKVLAALLVRVDEVWLVPKVLEAAQRVPELRESAGRDMWRKAEAETLARLLPRMTTSEAQSLTEEQRAYLRRCLEREISEDATVAILLTLASAQDHAAFVLAQHYIGSSSPRVQVAAQECLVELNQNATKL